MSEKSGVTYTQDEFDEAYEIGKRDGYEEAVQDIDQRTGGDGEYRYCTDRDPERHTPGPVEMIQRIVDRFETLNLLDEASKDGRDQDGPVAATGFDRIVAARKAHVDAVSAYNARLALAQSERARGNWSIKLDAEYRIMSDAQSEFIRVAQEVADAALKTEGSGQ